MNNLMSQFKRLCQQEIKIKKYIFYNICIYLKINIIKYNIILKCHVHKK